MYICSNILQLLINVSLVLPLVLGNRNNLLYIHALQVVPQNIYLLTFFSSSEITDSFLAFESSSHNS